MAAGAVAKAKKRKVNLLDAKRAQQMGIGLARLRWPEGSIREAIMTLNFPKVTRKREGEKRVLACTVRVMCVSCVCVCGYVYVYSRDYVYGYLYATRFVLSSFEY